VVTQADIEAGLLVITASGSSPSLPMAAQVVQAADWVVVADSKPQLEVDILAPNCTQDQSPGEGIAHAPSGQQKTAKRSASIAVFALLR